MPLSSISVVIPVRNRPVEIAAAIDSVMAQTLLPIEVIVVDDGSTDDTVAQVRVRTGDPVPVRIEALPENRGGGHARNVGIDAARGDWIALLDSDDRWVPDKLARQVERVAGAGSAVCFTNLAVNRHDGTPPEPWNAKAFADGDDVEAFILAHNQAVQTSTLLLPTQLARTIRFDERLRRHQDLDFVLRIHHRGTPFRYIDAPLVTYSADPTANRISKRKNAAPSMTWLAIAREYTPRPLLARFYAREIFSMEYEDAPLRALGRLAAGTARRDVPLTFAARSALREIVPARVKALTKRLAGR